ncbi:MAG: choice-of-anchor I family protein [Tissierellia bacterium]|nr:choice-of-anchor I family protein [Tissierellia bacterium]
MNWKRNLMALSLAGSLLASPVMAPVALAADQAVETTATLYEGVANKGAELKIRQIGRYNSGVMDEDGGTTEIVAYNEDLKVAYVINGKKQTLSRLPLGELKDGINLEMEAQSDIQVATLIEDKAQGFVYGDMTSVAYSSKKGLIAVALQDKDYSKPGYVAFFTDKEGKLVYQNMVKVGVQPDMVTFNAEGSLALTADEGEPRKGYGDKIVDPKGTISLVNTETMEVNTLDFTDYDEAEARAGLVKDGVVLKKKTNPSVDLEPEYITVSGNKAYVSLQEANAIAVVDLDQGKIEKIFSGGLVDHGEVPVDIDKSDKTYAPKKYEGLYGISMADGIASVELDGEVYLLLANEGDGREWGDEEDGSEHSNEKKGKKSPSGNITTEDKVTYFDSSDYEGLPEGEYDFLFGGRSFTILNSNGTRVYNSGDDFEELTNQYYPDYFNTSNDNVEREDRSGKKGPEPETVVVGTVGQKTYAFITLERISGVMVYDITDPSEAHFVNYINSRDFSADIKDDVSPEGLAFVAAEDSPTERALLLAAMEVSGTVAIYEMEGPEAPAPQEPEEPQEPGTTPAPEKPSFPWIPTGPILPTGTEEEPVEKPEEPQEETPALTAHEAIMTGFPDGSFRPNDDVSRAQFATLLTRMGLGSGAGSVPADVQGHWAQEAIAAIFHKGLMSGYPGGGFNPDGALTRGQAATILARLIQGEEAPANFTDTQGHWANGYIGAAVAGGLLQGYPDGSFRPDEALTRAEALTILARWQERSTRPQDLAGVDEAELITYPDVPKDHWAYWTILDATNPHLEGEGGLWQLAQED